MLYNLYNPDSKNGRKRIYKRAYRFYNNKPSKGYTNWNFSKVILITVLSIILAITYSYARLNFH
jgi:TM2 domain-containing membrane protein YozV